MSHLVARRYLLILFRMIKSALNWGPWFNGRAAYNRSNVPGQLVQSVKVIITSIESWISDLAGLCILISLESSKNASNIQSWEYKSDGRGIYSRTRI